MKSAFVKAVIRNVTRRPGRFLLLLAVSALGAAFFVGIKATADDMRLMADNYYKDTNLYDIHATGMIPDDVRTGDTEDSFLTYTADLFAIDNEDDRRLTRAHALPQGDDPSVNAVELLRGKMPENDTEMVCEEKFMRRLGLELGDTVTLESDGVLSGDTFTVVGTIRSPLYISADRGSSSLGDGHIECYIYLPADAFTLPYYTDLYITLRGTDTVNQLSDEYETLLDNAKDGVEAALDDTGAVYYLTTRGESSTYSAFTRDADRLEAIANVFPLIFYLVAALVALTSMTRMIEEHRTLIGLYKALGYSRFAVGMKYTLYALTAAGLGSVIGFSFGQVFFPNVIWSAYSALYSMSGFTTPHHVDLTSLSSAFSIGALLLVTVLTVRGTLRQRPALLMRPRPPAGGRRILLERVRPIWKRLSFTYKMTARNLFRYKKRLLMTIVGVMGCTALLMTGFGLRDSIGSIGSKQYGEIFTFDLQGVTKESGSSKVRELMEESIEEETGLTGLLWARQETVRLTTAKNSIEEDATLFVLSDPANDMVNLYDRKTGDKLTQTDEGVILTEKLAGRVGVKSGETMTLRDAENNPHTVKVLGICENYIGNFCYMTPGLYQMLWNDPENDTPAWNMFFAELSDQDGSEIAHSLLELPFVLRVGLSETMNTDIGDMVDVLDIVVVVLVLSAAALALVVLLSLTSITITERERELATLKVLGFFPGELAWYVYRENIILTLLGIIAGLFGGVLLHRYIIETIEVDLVSFARDIHPASFLYSAALTFVFAAAVNLIMNIRLKRIDMVGALKSVE